MQRIMNFFERYASRLYFFIRKKTKSKLERKLMFLFLTPALCVVAGVTCIIDKFFTDKGNNNYLHKLAIAAIMKDEGLYIEEWICYHIVRGVDKFYLFDNGSSDNVQTILKKYIDAGIVDYTYLPGRAKQLDAYYSATQKAKKTVKYLMFLDCDEFITTADATADLYEVIDSVFATYTNAAALAVNWYVYGSNGHKTRPDGLVTENFVYRAKDEAEPNELVKIIAKPRSIYCMNSPHTVYPKGCLCVVNEAGQIVTGPRIPYPNNKYNLLRINHYYCKSEEECKIKFSRGQADFEENIIRKWNEFIRFDLNDVYDNIVDCYIDRIYEEIEKYRYEH